MRYYNLDRQIVIETPTYTQDAAGQSIPTWSTYLTVQAHKVEYKGTETEQSSQTTSKNIVDLRIRYRSGVNAKMRVFYNSQYYNIITATEEGRKDYMLLKLTLRDNVNNV